MNDTRRNVLKILSIDTSTMVSSCSISENGIVIGDYSVNQEKTHSESLVPMVKRLLEDLGLKLRDIDLFAVGVGPGSFTGLRIGMTTIKTFAQVFEKPVIGVSTLEALAYNIYNEGIIMPVLDARGGRTYYGIFSQENGLIKRIEDDELIYMDELVAELNGKYSAITVVGEYTDESYDLLKGLDNVMFARSSSNNIIARNISEIALKKYGSCEIKNLDDIVPNYVRKSQAQRDLEKRM